MSDLLKHKLPTYTPPESVWEAVERGLEEAPLQEALHRLPTHTPPTELWAAIEQELPRPVIRRSGGWQYAAAAVVTGLLFFVGYFLLRFQQEESRVTYSEEHIPTKALPSGNIALDRQYEKLQAFCKTKTTVCEKPEFKHLKQQLDDLTLASKQLKEAIGEYNTDAALASQLSEIEQERAQLLQKLAERIM